MQSREPLGAKRFGQPRTHETNLIFNCYDNFKMNRALKDLILEFNLRKINKHEFISRLPFNVHQKTSIINDLFTDIISSQNSDEVELSLTLLWTLEENNEFLDILHKLIVAPWHTRYEDIIHDLQTRKSPESIPFIKQAIQNKYDYLESYETGTGQFISQCGYALYSIGTKEAHQTILELSKSNNDIIKAEMEYQLKRINNDQDAEDTKKTKRWWTI